MRSCPSPRRRSSPVAARTPARPARAARAARPAGAGWLHRHRRLRRHEREHRYGRLPHARGPGRQALRRYRHSVLRSHPRLLHRSVDDHQRWRHGGRLQDQVQRGLLQGHRRRILAQAEAGNTVLDQARLAACVASLEGMKGGGASCSRPPTFVVLLDCVTAFKAPSPPARRATRPTSTTTSSSPAKTVSATTANARRSSPPARRAIRLKPCSLPAAATTSKESCASARGRRASARRKARSGPRAPTPGRTRASTASR